MNNSDLELIERAINASLAAVEHKIGVVDARVAALTKRPARAAVGRSLEGGTSRIADTGIRTGPC
jgi:hypothetical protein